MARDLQAFFVFSQHSAWVYLTGKLIEKVFYCLNRCTDDVVENLSNTMLSPLHMQITKKILAEMFNLALP